MRKLKQQVQDGSNRRGFLQKGLAASGVGAIALMTESAYGKLQASELSGGTLTRGDAAILRLLAAVELIEADLWIQYNELGGVQDKEVPGQTGGSEPYIQALEVLDGDMPQYIHDNTEDEISHAAFINAYLRWKGVEPVNLDAYRILPSSTATGARNVGRLTNLMQLTVDTTWWTRYRSREHNPDLEPSFQFAQAVPSLANGQFPAIPRSDADLGPDDHIQAIANTAGFHFAYIEQGGSSLYPQLAQRVTDREVLRILLSIGGTEVTHFQTWQDKAGNAKPLTDPSNPKLVFPDLNEAPFGGEDFQTNLIMPEPCPFLNRKLPPVSILRPTETKGAAVATLKSFIADGLFIGQSRQFFAFLQDLAEDADNARFEG